MLTYCLLMIALKLAGQHIDLPPPQRAWDYRAGTEGDAVEHGDGRRHLRVAR